MTQRSPMTVGLLSLVTIGIYQIYWYVQTKKEMNNNGSQIPTAWLLIIPIASIYWIWKYSEGVEKETNGKLTGVLSFVLLYLVGFVGAAVVQDSFNKAGSAQPVANIPAAPAAGAMMPPQTPPQNPVA
jgi:hypothetical protein